MTSRSKSLIARFISTPSGSSSALSRALLILKVGLPMGAFVHATWVPIFFYLDLHVLAWWNLVVTLLFAIGSVLAHHPSRLLDRVFLLCVLEMPLHGMLATYYTGVETIFWIWPVTASTFVFGMITYSWPQRIAMSVGIGALTIVSMTWLVNLDPQVLLSDRWKAFFVASNLLGGMGQLAILFAIFQRVVETTETSLQREFDRAEGLLRNILPDPIALRLKNGEKVIADEHKDVSVVFADIVNFTEASARMSPTDLVETLNIVFTDFDRIARLYGAEKIKTIGDAYMIVVGAPDAEDNHAEVAVQIALEMLKSARAVSAKTHFPIDLRIGVNSGAVVAGVIGTSKFAYDLWGDAVNVASRMETHSNPGMIMITSDTRDRLSEAFSVSSAGIRDVKGKGEMEVFAVTSHVAMPV